MIRNGLMFMFMFLMCFFAAQGFQKNTPIEKEQKEKVIKMILESELFKLGVEKAFDKLENFELVTNNLLEEDLNIHYNNNKIKLIRSKDVDNNHSLSRIEFKEFQEKKGRLYVKLQLNQYHLTVQFKPTKDGWIYKKSCLKGRGYSNCDTDF